MKRGIRWICLLLVLATVFPWVPAAAAQHPEYGWVLVDYYGARERRHVLVEDNGSILAPLSWITYYGAQMKMEDRGEFLVYYRGDQQEERDFAKRLFIEPKTRHFTIGIYFKKSALRYKDRIFDHYYPLDHGFFSQMVEYAGELWVPITELLPLMDVQVAVGDDGYLYMRPVVMTTFRALYEHGRSVGPVLFDAESMILFKDGLTLGGYALGNVLDFRIDRQGINWSYGMENDYEEIFKSYLMDDAVFLETFDADGDIFGDYIAGVAEGKEEVECVFNIIGSISDDSGLLQGLYEFAPEGLKEGAKAVKSYSEGIQGIISLYCYADIYFNHIEDHRRMLDAVYTFEKDIAKTPSGKAASTVSKIYDKNADNSKKLIVEGTLDVLNKAISGTLKELSSKVLGPWYLALEITKFFAYEEIEYVKNCAYIDLVDNTVSYSRSIYGKRLNKAKFSRDDLDDMRLSLIMSLVGSRYAYKSYWKSGKEEEQDKIADILKDLYLAGVFREYDAEDSYDHLKSKYDGEISKLTVDTPSIHGDLPELEYAQVMTMFQWNRMPYYEWTLVDVDHDGAKELLVQGTMILQTAFGEEQLPFVYLADATSGKSSFIEPIMGLACPAYVTADGEWYLKSEDAYYTWEGLDWKQTEAPEGAVGAFFDCPSLEDFSRKGDVQTLMTKAERFTERRSDCHLVLETDVDADGDQDLLAVFSDPANRWSGALPNFGGIGYDVELRTDGLTTFLVVLREADGIRVRTNTAFIPNCDDPTDVGWSEQDRLLKVGDSLWQYMETGDPFVPWDYGIPEVTLIGLLGAPRSFVKSVLADYEEEDGFGAPCAMGMLGGDEVYVAYEEIDGEYVVRDARLTCMERDTYIMSGVPSSIEYTDLWFALEGLATDWSQVVPAYGPDNQIYAYETYFNFFHPDNGQMYTVWLLLEDEMWDSYIYGIYFMRQR